MLKFFSDKISVEDSNSEKSFFFTEIVLFVPNFSEKSFSMSIGNPVISTSTFNCEKIEEMMSVYYTTIDLFALKHSKNPLFNAFMSKFHSFMIFFSQFKTFNRPFSAILTRTALIIKVKGGLENNVDDTIEDRLIVDFSNLRNISIKENQLSIQVEDTGIRYLINPLEHFTAIELLSKIHKRTYSYLKLTLNSSKIDNNSFKQSNSIWFNCQVKLHLKETLDCQLSIQDSTMIIVNFNKEHIQRVDLEKLIFLSKSMKNEIYHLKLFFKKGLIMEITTEKTELELIRDNLVDVIEKGGNKRGMSSEESEIWSSFSGELTEERVCESVSSVSKERELLESKRVDAQNYSQLFTLSFLPEKNFKNLIETIKNIFIDDSRQLGSSETNNIPLGPSSETYVEWTLLSIASLVRKGHYLTTILNKEECSFKKSLLNIFFNIGILKRHHRADFSGFGKMFIVNYGWFLWTLIKKQEISDRLIHMSEGSDRIFHTFNCSFRFFSNS